MTNILLGSTADNELVFLHLYADHFYTYIYEKMINFQDINIYQIANTILEDMDNSDLFLLLLNYDCRPSELTEYFAHGEIAANLENYLDLDIVQSPFIVGDDTFYLIYDHVSLTLVPLKEYYTPQSALINLTDTEWFQHLYSRAKDPNYYNQMLLALTHWIETGTFN